jgi:hypothetical protein
MPRDRSGGHDLAAKLNREIGTAASGIGAARRMLDLPLPRFDLLKVDHYCSMAISLDGYFGWRVSGFLCSAMVWFQRSRRSTASEFTGSVR